MYLSIRVAVFKLTSNKNTGIQPVANQFLVRFVYVEVGSCWSLKVMFFF